MADCSVTTAHAPTFTPPPTSPVIVSNAEGTPISQQTGFIEWALLSGVDEHGLTAEHSLILLADADPNAPDVSQIHTGYPVIVLEIRHVGRQAYLFNHEGTTVPIYDQPQGAQIAQPQVLNFWLFGNFRARYPDLGVRACAAGTRSGKIRVLLGLEATRYPVKI